MFSCKTLSVQTTFGRYGFVYEVPSVVLFLLRPCLHPSLRGVSRTCTAVRVRARFARHLRTQFDRPTALPAAPESELRLSKSQVEGTRRAGRKPWGFTDIDSESTPSHRLSCLSFVLISFCARLRQSGRRIGQRLEPTGGPRQGPKTK